jgi:hypothetical protein
VSRDVGEISTNDALFQEQAATAVAAAASPHSPLCICCRTALTGQGRRHSSAPRRQSRQKRV